MDELRISDLALRHETVWKAVTLIRGYQQHRSVAVDASSIKMPYTMLVQQMQKVDQNCQPRYLANLALEDQLFTRTNDHKAICVFEDELFFRACSICFEYLKAQNISVCEAGCSFICCEDCMIRALEYQPLCPSCRAPVPKALHIAKGCKALSVLQLKTIEVEELLERRKMDLIQMRLYRRWS
ncbi:hypothetical protein BC833DRAFT_606457 [Globomyces pollinis-pini]|nr:hypothetical protein BC833DRAFT_606457 [Globomyces pollinis-pini]KAJ2995033.1 hypothetical protein HDV02_001110 [Globomyces sp. JEL0801]